MATISTYKLNGVERTAPREWQDLQVLATFDGDSVQANITTSELSFVNDAKAAIDAWMAVYPTEGMPLEIEIESETSSYGVFKGYLDFRTWKEKSPVEVTCSIKQDNGLATLDQRLRGITLELLRQKNAIGNADYVNIPYIVSNRKTTLEKVTLLTQVFLILKAGYDEGHKFYNIASDIYSAGIIIALANLAATIVALISITLQLIDLIQQVQEAFFPPVRYHRGISLKRAIERAVNYCGYTLECGAFDDIISKVALCPSKNDEIGQLNPVSGITGILNTNDFGYVSSDLFALANMLFYTKVAIVGNVVQLRPYNDPYWIQSSTFNMPNILVEQGFVQNGIKSINYDELFSSRILKYTTDDSDAWTLTTVDEQVSVTTVTPINVIDQKKVLLTDSEQITIPYALAVRKGIGDEILDLFNATVDQVAAFRSVIEVAFMALQNILGPFPPLLNAVNTISNNRIGSMKVENHFFSTPKIVWLEDDRIPENYATKIGAVALATKYHSYKSFVPGVRNTGNLADTNCKDVYTGATMPMGIGNFNDLIVNSFFTGTSGNNGKFTAIKWTMNKDKAEVDYYTQSQWAVNIEENTI